MFFLAVFINFVGPFANWCLSIHFFTAAYRKSSVSCLWLMHTYITEGHYNRQPESKTEKIKCREGVKEAGCHMSLRSSSSGINEGDGWKEFKSKSRSRVAEFIITKWCNSGCWRCLR